MNFSYFHTRSYEKILMVLEIILITPRPEGTGNELGRHWELDLLALHQFRVFDTYFLHHSGNFDYLDDLIL